MKKSLLFSAFLFIGCSNLFSQINQYKPFPNAGAIWEVSDTGPYGPGLNTHTTHIRCTVSGDTIIGSFTYKKVVQAKSPFQTGPTYSFGPDSFSFAYRNDNLNKKVYYLNTTGGVNKDTLWYDFNLNVGDTIKNSFSFSNQNGFNTNQRRIVSTIDSVNICGIYHKQFQVCINGGGFETQLIEGLGFKDNFIKTLFIDCPFEPVYIDHTTLSTCGFASIYESNSIKNLVQVYPNPVTTELKITNSQTTFCDYTIINTIGKLILKGSYTDKEFINVSALTNGLYVIELHDKQGNAYQSKFIK